MRRSRVGCAVTRDALVMVIIAGALLAFAAYKTGRYDQRAWDRLGCHCPMTCDPAVVP